MKELHLFAGIGGGIYGGMLLGHKCIGAIEIDSFCQDVLRKRQEDGWMEDFDIKSDLTKIPGTGYKGLFDIVCGGFPCQAFSTAARGRNIHEKDLWHEMLRFIQESDAPIVFAENVTKKAINIAKEDLINVGYKVSIARVSNSILGSNHQRNRFWALGVREGKEEELIKVYKKLKKKFKFSGDFWTKKVYECGKIDQESKYRRKQLKGIGNAQSPLVAAIAFRILVNRLYLKISSSIEYDEPTISPSKKELSKVFEIKQSWICKKYGNDFGFLHTPTTMANYSAPSMMKHKGCRNFVEVFGQPNPDNAEWLMGFPINASSLNTQNNNNLKKWKKLTFSKEV